MHPKLGFDPVKDFSAVSLMATIPLVLVVHPSLPVKSVKELIALAKARPGQMSYGSAGNGTAQQLSGELFKLLTETDIVAVPYRGGAPATFGVLTGEVQMLFTGALAVFPHVKAGKLRALAVTTSQRLESAPELPTVAEAGVYHQRMQPESALGRRLRIEDGGDVHFELDLAHDRGTVLARNSERRAFE